jgi:hypothetical protein
MLSRPARGAHQPIRLNPNRAVPLAMGLGLETFDEPLSARSAVGERTAAADFPGGFSTELAYPRLARRLNGKPAWAFKAVRKAL